MNALAAFVLYLAWLMISAYRAATTRHAPPREKRLASSPYRESSEPRLTLREVEELFALELKRKATREELAALRWEFEKTLRRGDR